MLRRCSAPTRPARDGRRAGGDETVVDPYRWVAEEVLGKGRVVDLACGSAPLDAEVGDKSDYLGIDTSVAELRLAARRGARVVRADATRLPLGTRTVDTVVSAMALMLVPLPQTLAEVARVLRPGGRLVAVVPATGPLQPRDWVRYARLLLALRVRALSYPQDDALAALTSRGTMSGLRVVSDVRVRFAYRLEPGTGELLLESLYLPHASARARRRAHRLVANWSGEIGIPLRRLVLTAETEQEAP